MGQIPSWAWALIFSNVLTSVVVISTVKNDVKHLIGDFRDMKTRISKLEWRLYDSGPKQPAP